MFECPACKNEISKVHVAIDTAHNLLRIWCPFCRVWWSVKCKMGEKLPINGTGDSISLEGTDMISERLVVTVCA